MTQRWFEKFRSGDFNLEEAVGLQQLERRFEGLRGS